MMLDLGKKIHQKCLIRHVIQADIFNHQYRRWYKRGHWSAKAMSLFKGPPTGYHIMPFGLKSGPLQNGQRRNSINIFCIVCLTLGFLACQVRASKEKPLDLESKSCLLTKNAGFKIHEFLFLFQPVMTNFTPRASVEGLTLQCKNTIVSRYYFSFQYVHKEK